MYLRRAGAGMRLSCPWTTSANAPPFWPALTSCFSCTMPLVG